MSDDAEFDAFLKGEDALSRRMQAMPQAAPSAALDAAILQRAKDLMAQEARPEAANDAGASTPAPRVAGLSWRWRVPAGIAATVLAGVFAHQAFQASVDMEQSAGMPAPVEERAVMPQPPAAEPPAAEPPAQAMPAPKVAVPLAAAPAAAPAPVMQDHAADKAVAPPPPVSAPAEPVAVQERPAAAPAAPSANYYSRAPEVEAAARAKREELQRSSARRADVGTFEKVEVSGSRTKADALDKAPAEWLAAIEAMLGEAKDAQALDEWNKFRKMYPDYPVPQTTEERIKAIPK